MEILLTRIIRELIFWLAWIIIPVLWEISPAIIGFFILLKKRYITPSYPYPEKYPEICVIVPVFNSAETLRACINSIHNGTYPYQQITVFVVDNGSSDDSRQVFLECQDKYKDMPMWWLTSQQGKSKALNLALFNSKGKYIFNIDSDGVLEKNALTKMVERFESKPDVHCMTGAIMVDSKKVENTENFFLRFIRRCELFEYAQAFLAGRNYQSELKSVYTLSGAFSAFRKSTILKTFQYNSTTVAEDTELTFQIRMLLKHNIDICEDAIFLVDPIDSIDKLYTQRQRWQRGEIEVSHLFLKDKLNPLVGYINNFMVRVLMYDHTFAFPRAIWYFALMFLVFINYPIKLIVSSLIIIYFLYVLTAFLYYINIRMYLKDFREMRRYYTRQWYMCFAYPLFNFLVFFIRLAGIINSIKTDMSWKTMTLSQEWAAFKKVLKSDFKKINSYLDKVREVLTK